MENKNIASLKSLSAAEISKIEEFRKAKQTAVLAILFSDIVNSTFATEKLGEQTYARLRHIHDDLFKNIMCRDQAGIIIKEIGDSFLCVFAEPSTAVLRALEFQHAIHKNKDNLTIHGYTLMVKIGIHVGQVAVENSLALDIFGRHVNRASRIESLANGGQILTSLSIWENAVGWLKDNRNEEKIGWISHGKVKLKGVEEKVDIFEFYSKETGKLPIPKIIQKEKSKRILIGISTLIILVLAAIVFIPKFISTSSNNKSTLVSTARKSYYIQFDFSDFANHATRNSHIPIIDTVAIGEQLLAQAITILSPDSISTESDLINSISKNGKIYSRRLLDFNNPKNYMDDIGYFRDSSKFSGIVFVKAILNIKSTEKPIRLFTRLFTFDNSKSYWSTATDEVFSVESIENGFRSNLQNSLLQNRLNTIQGYVTNLNDSILLFRLTKEATLREGAKISLMRPYNGINGLRQQLEDVRKRIEYYKFNAKDSSTILKPLYREFDRIKEAIANNSVEGAYSEGVYIEGKVIALYDSTGKAKWNIETDYPYDRPQSGDIIYPGR